MAGACSYGLDASADAGGVVPVQGGVAEDGEVDRSVTGAGGVAVFTEHDITLPVDHLAAPVLPHDPRTRSARV